MRVRVVGDASLGWLDAVQLWGAPVEAFISQGGNCKHLVDNLYPDVYVAPLAAGLRMVPHGSWDGVAVSTVKTTEDALKLRELIKVWKPAFVLVTGHACISQSKFNQWFDLSNEGYEHTLQHFHYDR